MTSSNAITKSTPPPPVLNKRHKRAYARPVQRRIGSALPLLALLLIASSAFAPRIAQAQTALVCPTAIGPQETVCNFGEAAGSADQVGYSTTLSARQQLAGSFTTGSTDTGYNLRSVQIFVSNVEGTPGAFIVAIHDAETDGSGNVTGVGENPIGTLSGDEPTGGSTDDVPVYTASGIFLRPSATYFIVLSAPNAPSGADNAYRIRIATTTPQTGSPGWELGDSLYSKLDNGPFTKFSGTFVISHAIVADVNLALKLKLRVFLESALP